MADADVMKAIREHCDARPAAVLAAFLDAADIDLREQYERVEVAKGLNAAFSAAAASLRKEADLRALAKHKGWQGVAKELTTVAARLASIGTTLDGAIGFDNGKPVKVGDPIPEMPGVRALRGHLEQVHEVSTDVADDYDALTKLHTEDHAQGVDAHSKDHDIDDLWLRKPVQLSHATNGNLVYRPDPDPSLLDGTATLAEQPGEDVAVAIDAIVVTGFPPAGTSEATLAYLRGDTDDPNGAAATLVVDPNGSVHGPDDRNYSAAPTPDLHQEAKAMTQTFPMENPFLDPEPASSGRPRVDAPDAWVQQHRYDYLKLMTPATDPKFDHWSWSQLTTSEDCGLRYRAGKVDNVPQVPQWANIGGRAFHAASEAFDRALLKGTLVDLDALVVNPVKLADLLATWWRERFAAEIREVEQATGLAMGEEGQHYRASGKGLENYTWWLIEGAEMLKRYVTWRLSVRAELGALQLDGEPVIEHEFVMPVWGPLGELKVMGYIDRAFLRGDGTLVVMDLKTGKSGADDAQHGLYAHALRQHPNVEGMLVPTTLAQTFDARRGILSDPIDALDRHPWEEYVYRFHAAEAKRRQGIYTPRRSTFCGGCSVRYACPIGG